MDALKSKGLASAALCLLLVVAFPTNSKAQTFAEIQLSLLHPAAALEAHAAAQFAIAKTTEFFAGIPGQSPPHNNAADAFRHALWNAKMKASIGEELAKKFGDAHEESPDNPPLEKAMDLHNNARGRSIPVTDSSGDAVTDDDLVFAVTQLALLGELAVIQGPDATAVMIEIIGVR
jgi:hypothetical protein